MPVPIHTRAEKYLTGMPSYRSAAEIDSGAWAKGMSLQAKEAIIGLYQNVPGEVADSIVVTNLGIHWLSTSGVRFIDYSAIDGMDYPVHDKVALHANVDLRRLVITLVSGEKLNVPIIGTEGRGLDVSSFYSFISGACQTIEIENRNKPSNNERASA
jgi:hypothetical protein